MAHIFKYTILTAVPDPRRGERVNVGIVVFRENDIDIRFRMASTKLKALTGQRWESQIEAMQTRISSIFDRDSPPEDMLRLMHEIDPIISAVGLGTITAVNPDDYETRIEEILSSLVVLPKKPRLAADAQSRINTEIAKVFRNDKVLAAPQEGIETKGSSGCTE